MTALAVAGAHAAVLAWLARAPASGPASVPAPLPAWAVPAEPATRPGPSAPAPHARAARVDPEPTTPAAEPPRTDALPAPAGEAPADPPAPPQDPATVKTEPAAEPPEVVAAAPAEPRPDLPAPLAWPAAAELQYDVEGEARGVGYRASATLRWRTDGSHYVLTLALRALWLQRSQHSEGEIGPDGLRPARFTDRARRERTLSFEWTDDGHGRAVRDDGQALPALAPGTQDRLSLFVQLGALLQRDGAAPGRRWTLPVAGLGGVQPWTFEVTGQETLTLGPGATVAVRVQRGGAAGGPETTLWYAPAAWGPLPVRVLLREPDGQRVDQILRDGKIDASP